MKSSSASSDALHDETRALIDENRHDENDEWRTTKLEGTTKSE
jgi:hypothetical protein